MKDIRLMIAEKMDDLLDAVLSDVAYDLDVDDADLDYDVMQEVSDEWDTMVDKITEAVENHVQAVVEVKSEQLLEEWKVWCLPIIKEECEQDGVMDRPARREDWCNFVDAKQKNGEISEFVAELVDADVEAV